MVTLYRFEKVEECRLSTLENGLLWLSSPNYFNDLIDCRLQIRVSKNKVFPLSHIKKALKVLYDQSRYKIHHPMEEKNVSSLLELFYSDAHENSFKKRYITSFVRDDILQRTAICCFFSSEPTDPLMWAHYGDNHLGFCTEYEVDIESNLTDEILLRVNYLSNVPIIEIEDLLFCPISTIERLVTSKSLRWVHEHEYRIVYLNKLRRKTERGVAVKRPEWLIPKRVICGQRQKTLSDGGKRNMQMELLAKRMGATRARIEIRGNDLVIEDI